MGGKYKYTRKGKVWLTVELPFSGVTVQFTKPRQSVLRNLRHATPNWSKAVLEQQRYYALSKEEQDAYDEPPIVVPGEELEAISEYLVRCTYSVLDIIDDDGEVFDWRKETHEERLYWWETLEFGDQTHAWGQLAGKLYAVKAISKASRKDAA